MKESQPTQQVVEIEEIKNGAAILKNGGLRRILMVTGINTELKSEEEQNVIIYAFQNFLNALDFSVQFVVHSRKMNIGAYLEKLAERERREDNDLLRNQILEYAEFIRSFVESNAVMAKTFFAVVAYDPITVPSGSEKLLGIFKFGGKTASLEESLEHKFVQLNHRVNQVIRGLSQIGLRAVALNDEEMIELFYNLYNPQTVEKKDFKIANG